MANIFDSIIPGLKDARTSVGQARDIQRKEQSLREQSIMLQQLQANLTAKQTQIKLEEQQDKEAAKIISDFRQNTKEMDPNDPRKSALQKYSMQRLTQLPKYKDMVSGLYRAGVVGGQQGAPSPQEGADLFGFVSPPPRPIPLGTSAVETTEGIGFPTFDQDTGRVSIQQTGAQAMPDPSKAPAPAPFTVGENDPSGLPVGTVAQYDRFGNLSIVKDAPKGEKLPLEEKVPRAIDMRKEWNALPAVKNMDKLLSSLGIMEAGVKSALDPNTKSYVGADQALLVTFQRILDPDSVVRQSEYARTGEGVAFFNRLKGFYERIESGGVSITAADRVELFKMGQKVIEEWKKTFNDRYDEYAQTADNPKLGLDKEIIFGGRKKFNVNEDRLKFDVDAALSKFERKMSEGEATSATDTFNQSMQQPVDKQQQIEALQRQLQEIDAQLQQPIQPPTQEISTPPTPPKNQTQVVDIPGKIANIVRGNAKAQRQVAIWRTQTKLSDGSILRALEDEKIRKELGIK